MDVRTRTKSDQENTSRATANSEFHAGDRHHRKQFDMQIRVASRKDYRYCREVMRAASQNYSFASLFFPRAILPHVEALYAFMRIGDDRVDVSHQGFRSPQEAIEDWEDTYWKAFDIGDSPHPVMRAYLDTASEFGIPPELMKPYFRAMKDDLSISRFPSFNDLLYYVEGSAMTVGRAMTHILGVKEEQRFDEAIAAADSLSIGMQLSNFWRDIGQDYKIGRIYLPQEDMQCFSYSENELARGLNNSRFNALMEFEIERTEEYYQHAHSGIELLSNGQWAVLSGLEIYRSILDDIRRNQYDVFAKRAGSSTVQKIIVALRSYIQSRNY
jgi:phytoene synthase